MAGRVQLSRPHVFTNQGQSDPFQFALAADQLVAGPCRTKRDQLGQRLSPSVHELFRSDVQDHESDLLPIAEDSQRDFLVRRRHVLHYDRVRADRGHNSRQDLREMGQ